MQFKLEEVFNGNKLLWNKDKNILFTKLKKFINTKIEVKNDFFIKKYFKDKNIYEISLKQFIIQKSINIFFNYELTKSLTKKKTFSYPLPSEILKIYQDEIIKVNFFLSNLKLIKFLFTELIRGTYIFFKIFLSIGFNENKNFYKKFFFHSFTKVFLREKINLKKNSLFEWFLRDNEYIFKNNHILISHSDKNKKKYEEKNFQISYNQLLPVPIKSIKNKLKFLLNFLIILFINLKDIFILNWKSSILFAEKVIYLNFHYCNKIELYDEYFFNNSEWLYKPLWTYKAEQRDSNISMIYYSINDLPTEDISKYKNEKEYLRIFHHHEIMTWQRYYAWTEDHKNHLNYVLNENLPKQILVKGYFILETGKEFQPIEQKKTITCFPITPIDPVINVINQRHSNYLTFDSCKLFIKNIVQYYEKLNIKVYFKLKRNFNNQSNDDYKNFYNKMLEQGKFFNLDPETDIEEIIEKSDLIISAPFTSVSTVSKIKGKKTIYYDPTKSLNKPNHQKAAYNVPIIFDLKDLDLNDF